MKTSELSAFGQLALKLDQNFSGLERLAQQIQRLDLRTDNGLEHGTKLLNQFAQYGEGISEGIQEFAKALDEARLRSEEATTLVVARAEEIHARNREQSELQERFNHLGTKVQAVNAGLVQLKKPTLSALSPEDRVELNSKLQEMDGFLGTFVDEAMALKTEAESLNLKRIGRDAESLHGTLISARSKLSTIFS